MNILNYIVFAAAILALGGCSMSSGGRPGAASESRDHRSESLEEIQSEIQDETIHPLAYHHYINGLLYTEITDYRSAAESFTIALQYHPNSYQIRYALAEALYSQRSFGQAIEVLEPITPVDADVYSLRAACYMALGISESAHRAYRELVRLDSSSTTAFAFLGNNYRERNDLDSVIWVYGHLARLRPDNERYWQELGRLQGMRGDLDQARQSFSTSISLRADPTNIMSFVGLAETYSLENRYDSALIVYEEVLEIDPDNILINREMATLYAQMDSLEQAVPYARKVAELTPDDPIALRRLGAMYFATGSHRLADSAFSHLVNSGDTHPLNYYYLGRVAVAEEDYTRAIDEFTVLTQLADSSAESWLDLGFAYQRADQPEKEIETYETGLSHMLDENESERLLFALAMACERNAQFEKAVTTLEGIIARSPDNDKALNYLGYMLADRGERLEYARELIERAVALSPDNGAYIDSYGWVFYRIGRFEEALVYLKQAATLDSDPVIFDHLGDAFQATGDMESARLWWQKALELQPDDEKIKQKLDE